MEQKKGLRPRVLEGFPEAFVELLITVLKLYLYNGP